MFVIYFFRSVLWWLSCVGVCGFGRLIVICVVRKSVCSVGVQWKIWGLK